MTNENVDNSIEEIDEADAEGHAIRAGKLDEASGADVEGHAVKSGRIDDAADDGEDVEGHGPPGKPRVRF